MTTIEQATEDLVDYTNTYIVNNKMKFGKEEYTELVTTLCILSDFESKLANSPKSWDDFFTNAGSTIAGTDRLVRAYVSAATKFMPALCPPNMILTVGGIVDNWTTIENRLRLAYVAEKLLKIEVREKYSSFLGDISNRQTPRSYSTE
jgi:hypothetical protein